MSDAIAFKYRTGTPWATVQRLVDYTLFGHPLYRQPALEGRLHWASTETADEYAGHIEGALAAGEHAAQAVMARPFIPHGRSDHGVPCAGR